MNAQRVGLRMSSLSVMAGHARWQQSRSRREWPGPSAHMFPVCVSVSVSSLFGFFSTRIRIILCSQPSICVYLHLDQQLHLYLYLHRYLPVNLLMSSCSVLLVLCCFVFSCCFVLSVSVLVVLSFVLSVFGFVFLSLLRCLSSCRFHVSC